MPQLCSKRFQDKTKFERCNYKFNENTINKKIEGLEIFLLTRYLEAARY